MEVEDAVVKPIAVGAIVFIMNQIFAWILDAVSLGPFNAATLNLTTLNLTAPGIVGLAILFWATGWIVIAVVPKILKSLGGLRRKSLSFMET